MHFQNKLFHQHVDTFIMLGHYSIIYRHMHIHTDYFDVIVGAPFYN